MRSSVVEARPETYRLVVVAFVPVALAKMNGPVRVVDAEERPPVKVMSVVVAFEGNGYPTVLEMTPVEEL